MIAAIQQYISLFTNVLFTGPLGILVFIIFGSALVYMIFWLYREGNRAKYLATIEWIFLEVKVDELSEKSPLAMEIVFTALHAIHTGSTWGEATFGGKVVLSLSCEIVSLGGKVSYIFRLPKNFRTLLESAIFAQYPKAEIHEVEDYLKNLPHHYVPETAEFDFFGTQFLKKKDNAYPIRLYNAKDSSFEHTAQETIIDPLANLIEVFSNLQPYEMMAFQLALKPVDDSWKEHSKHLIEKLKGVPHKHESNAFMTAILFIPDLIAGFLMSALGVEAAEGHGETHAVEPPSQMMHKSDVEKMVISAVEHAMSKVTYEVKIRTMYLAPKAKYNKAMRVPELIGALRYFDDINLNGMKPDIGHTWTEGPSYRIFQALERPYIEVAKLTRKRHFLHNFMDRTAWRGSGQVFMNTEELATLYHFPQAPNVRVSQLERVSAVKVAPPINLPVK